MFNVVIKNLQGLVSHSGKFALLENANQWVNKQKSVLSWGKVAGGYPLSQLSQEELAQEMSRILVDELGNSLPDPLIEIPDQFTIEITDITNSYYMGLLREKRNQLLQESDFSQLQDSPLSSEQKASWATYRQILRDLPQNVVDILNPIWPIKPT